MLPVQRLDSTVSYLHTANSDEKLILLWLNSKKPQSRKTYSYNIQQFFNLVNTPLQEIKLEQTNIYGEKLKTLTKICFENNGIN